MVKCVVKATRIELPPALEGVDIRTTLARNRIALAPQSRASGLWVRSPPLPPLNSRSLLFLRANTDRQARSPCGSFHDCCRQATNDFYDSEESAAMD